MPTLTAVVGTATAAYGVGLVAQPRLLITPIALEDSRDTRTLVRVLGGRDVVLGLAMLAAPAGRARRLVTAARVVADWSDAVLFGTGLAGRRTRGPVAAAATLWGAVCLAAGVLDERAGR